MKFRWDKLGGQLGILYCIAGFVLIFLGWNGAASYDRVSAQIPYIVSGGLAGLALVVLGGAMLVSSGNRRDRAALQASIDDLRAALDREAGMVTAVATGGAAAGGAGEVMAGTSSYHRPDCQLIEGQAGLTPMTAESAAATGLEACRICTP
jgi:hypothetical protein